MDRSYVILCATDFSVASRAAIATTVEFARHGVATCIHLVHVVDLTPTCKTAIDGAPPQCEPRLIEAERELASVLAALRTQLEGAAPSVEVHSVLRGGEAAAEIVSVVHELDVDLVVVGTHGHTGLDRLVLGSVSAYIAAHAPCTVVVARTRRPRAVGDAVREDLMRSASFTIPVTGASFDAASTPAVQGLQHAQHLRDDAPRPHAPTRLAESAPLPRATTLRG